MPSPRPLESASDRSVRIRGGDDFDETAVRQVEEGLLDAEGLALVDAIEGESEGVAIGLDAVVEIGNPHHQVIESSQSHLCVSSSER